MFMMCMSMARRWLNGRLNSENTVSVSLLQRSLCPALNHQKYQSSWDFHDDLRAIFCASTEPPPCLPGLCFPWVTYENGWATIDPPPCHHWRPTATNNDHYGDHAVHGVNGNVQLNYLWTTYIIWRPLDDHSTSILQLTTAILAPPFCLLWVTFEQPASPVSSVLQFRSVVVRVHALHLGKFLFFWTKLSNVPAS